MNRRKFLRQSALFTTTACCSAAWGGPGHVRRAFAQTSNNNGNTIIYLNQFGGNDHLNSFAVPYTLGSYYDRRPSLAIPANTVLDLAQGIGFNPILSNLYSLYLEGRVAIIQGVGDPIGNRSHFTSQEYQSRGVTDFSNKDKRGWLGRLGDLYLTDLPFNTIGLGVGSLKDFTSKRTQNLPMVSQRLDDLNLPNQNEVIEAENNHRHELAIALARQEATVPLSARVADARRGLQTFYNSVATIKQVRDEYSSGITYPETGIGTLMQDSAKLIQSSRTEPKVIYTGIGGWDTHGNQTGAHTTLLEQVDQAIGALAQDLKAMNKWNSTTICIFTEFGRVNFQNASAGTDHAKAGAFVLIGGNVRGGVYGNSPTSGQIANQDFLDMEIDFRNVFAQTIQWLGFDPAPVFPENYDQTPLNLFA